MYITLYASKNTGKEEKESFIKAATAMAKKAKANEEARLAMGQDIHESHDDQMKKGIKSMIAASMIASSGRVVSATMASFLLRNESRYHFSHKFTFINIQAFLVADANDITLSSSPDGIPFITSNVSNYIHRPNIYNDECLYDMISNFSFQRRGRHDNGTSNWLPAHLSGDRIKIVRRKIPSIPIVTNFDFEDTRKYGGKFIITAKIEDCTEAELDAMETNAKTSSILFIPFRNIDDLKDDKGRFLTKFKQWFAIPRNKHTTILQNLQVTHNSFNAGRPEDPLEKLTEPPPLPKETKKKPKKIV